METIVRESLVATDKYSAAGAVAPRVALRDIEGRIDNVVFFTGGDAARTFGVPTGFPRGLDTLTICLVTMKNGFTVVGKSAPASPENFDMMKGRELAYEDAIRQLWPLEGYLLCERNSQA